MAFLVETSVHVVNSSLYTVSLNWPINECAIRFSGNACSQGSIWLEMSTVFHSFPSPFRISALLNYTLSTLLVIHRTVSSGDAHESGKYLEDSLEFRFESGTPRYQPGRCRSNT
jgi:hypothetical protein